MPRKASKSRYDDRLDEHRGTDLLLQATEGFENVQVSHVGEQIDTHGFSSFKFIPGTNEQIIVAIKSVELGENCSTYMLVFKINGEVILPETKIGDYKYEGIEFI